MATKTQTPKATAKRALTYLGRRCQMWEIRKAGPAGERYVFTRWIDDADPRNGGWAAGTITVRRIKGNGLRNTLVELEPTRAIDPREATNPTIWTF